MVTTGLPASLDRPHPRWEGGSIADYDFSSADAGLDIEGLQSFFAEELT